MELSVQQPSLGRMSLPAQPYALLQSKIAHRIVLGDVDGETEDSEAMDLNRHGTGQKKNHLKKLSSLSRPSACLQICSNVTRRHILDV